MRTTISTAAVVAAMLLVAGYATPTASADPAAPDHRTTFVFIEPNACTGEAVLFVAYQHVVVTDFVDHAGRVHVHVAGQVHSIEGIGQTTGDRYISQGATSLSFTASTVDENATTVFTETTTSRVVRLGETGTKDDMLVQFRRHTTVNANGEVTATFDDVTITCT